MKTERRVFVSDCEGPISKNDNAYELTEHLVPQGDKLFARISKYDDVLADVVERPDYKAGDTLRLIVPFLRAYGATNQELGRFSASNLLLVPSAGETLRFIKSMMPSFIVSTSYEQYMQALCSATNFPYTNVYCTKLDIDRYRIDEEEIEDLKQLGKEIVNMPMIQIPDEARKLEDLSERDQRTIRRLDEIFWDEISQMESGRMLEEVNPVGGSQKADAVRDVVNRVKGTLSGIVYFGDSITDVQCFQLVREGGGLAVSFNGNRYAIREAEIAVLSDHTIILSILAEVFNRLGKQGVLHLVEDWGRSVLQKYCTPVLRRRLFTLYSGELPKLELIARNSREELMRESTAFRRTVRGEEIGELG
ncbi:hypothetical protein GWN63_04600 [Candidatus Bathyarchaeota archaeon]|nr:hypothetical protein [Candidatus Bathyarchaeota archaeon]NIU81506.1 hypothetical protein [Candidatus Bathyarchaeota archaeon]NIV68141.1 hypothetical protein [Candidatus Bathyarchaeota archaeon]NIW16203.1 hypothetical protein [Candidatus Bathyarchaeota archaeon]NIW34656.1 hypothetical protein [Candidatus Bathyarchaeota archaeon]